MGKAIAYTRGEYVSDLLKGRSDPQAMPRIVKRVAELTGLPDEFVRRSGGRLEIGAQTLLEPGVWITAPGSARIRIGSGTFLNLGVMVAAVELVEIGDHCMFANGCFVTDGNHRFDDPDQPVTWQGFTSKGPTRNGDNVWCGARVAARDSGAGSVAVRNGRRRSLRAVSRSCRSTPSSFGGCRST